MCIDKFASAHRSIARLLQRYCISTPRISNFSKLSRDQNRANVSIRCGRATVLCQSSSIPRKQSSCTCALHTRSRMMKRTAYSPYMHTPATFAEKQNVMLRALRYSDFTPALCLSRQKNITAREVNRRHTYMLH